MTNFGEITEPSTRSAWEDWEEVTAIDEFSLHWKQNALKPNNITSLIIIEGKYLSNYIYHKAKAHLLLIDSIPEVNLYLYQIQNSKKYVCLIKEFDLLRSSETVENLKDQILASESVIAIQNKPLSEYQIATSVQECVIRSIYTGNSSKIGDFPKMEQPNIISGFSAGAISLREQMNLPGAAYICYNEYPGEFEVQDFHRLFAVLAKQKDDFLFNMLANHQNVQTDSYNSLNSNLYI